MKKETLIASSMGIVLGVLVALVVLFYTDFSAGGGKERDVIAHEDSLITPTVVLKKQEASLFQLEEPENDIIVTENVVTIRGKASTNSLLIFQSATSQKIEKVTEESFAVDFPLSIGENMIQMSMYAEGKGSLPQEKEIRIYYFK